MSARPIPPPPTIFSARSTPAVPDSLWHANDFLLGAGMVIIQPSTDKIVVLSDEIKDARGKSRQYFFLPKGRKDRGESLEQAALREAHEESGYRVSFLPLFIPTHAPVPPEEREKGGYDLPTTSEPIFIGLHEWRKGHWGSDDLGGEYLTFWYVGQIPEDAVVETGTRMPDEVGYKTHLVTLDVAVQVLGASLAHIVRIAYEHWAFTKEYYQNQEWLDYMQEMGLDPVAIAAGSLPVQTNALAHPRGNTFQPDERGTASSSRDTRDTRAASF